MKHYIWFPEVQCYSVLFWKFLFECVTKLKSPFTEPNKTSLKAKQMQGKISEVLGGLKLVKNV